MERLQGGLAEHAFSGCWLSIGNFDGVHLGHQAILRELVRRAREDELPAVALTFEPHPLALLNPQRTPPRLTTPDQRAALVANLGVDVLVEYPTDLEFLKLTAEDFFHAFVEQRLQARGLVEGPNFNYGRNRAGSIQTLRADCLRSGRELQIVEAAIVDGEMVSSSRTRAAIGAGDIPAANSMLGREYAVSGVVAEGARRGRTLGFPTANLPSPDTMLPGDGVYAGSVALNEGTFAAAVHIGPNPTFGEGARKLEAHLLDYSGDLYGQRIEVALRRRLRGPTKFDSLAELQTQITTDVAAVRASE